MKTPTESTETKTSMKCDIEIPLGPKIPGEDPRGPATLIAAQCCGNCVHVSRPKNPDDHIPFYEVPKTERWCYKHNWYITRECVCQDFEPESKKGGIPACKRAFAFNKKAEEIRDICERMKRLNVPYAYEGVNYIRYSIDENRPYIKKEYYRTTRWNNNIGESESCEPYWEEYYSHGPKDSHTQKEIKIIKEYLDNLEKNMGGEND